MPGLFIGSVLSSGLSTLRTVVRSAAWHPGFTQTRFSKEWAGKMGSESRLQFAKMHGLGNDFVVIDLVRQTLPEGWLAAERIRRLADRHFGIGFDQLLLVEPARSVDNDFRYRIFNADGGEVEQCGNGARCFARFVVEQGLFHGETVRVETRAGDIVLQLDADGQVTVNMGSPRLAPADIPFRNDGLEQGAQGAWFLPLDLTDSHGGFVALFPVSMGNPHAVIQVESTEAAPVESWGPWLEQHPQFPARVNVGFMQVQARDEIRLRVYERGAGETLACGTGACAAVVAGIHQGWLDSTVRVHLRGGDLQITYDGQLGPVMMRGPAATVFTGSMSLDAGSDPA